MVETRTHERSRRSITVQSSRKSRPAPPTSICELPKYIFKWRNDPLDLSKLHSTEKYIQHLYLIRRRHPTSKFEILHKCEVQAKGSPLPCPPRKPCSLWFSARRTATRHLAFTLPPRLTGRWFSNLRVHLTSYLISLSFGFLTGQCDNHSSCLVSANYMLDISLAWPYLIPRRGGHGVGFEWRGGVSSRQTEDVGVGMVCSSGRRESGYEGWQWWEVSVWQGSRGFPDS